MGGKYLVKRLLRPLLLMAASVQGAEPYRPARDDEILERLPVSFLESRDEITSLREQLASDPNNVDLATRVADKYMKLGSQEGDPRYYGYARAAIQPWWEQATPPLEILRKRAKLKERDHLYDQALSDFATLVQYHPSDANGWISLANIHRVQGQYDKAAQACDSLAEVADSGSIALCRAPIWASVGKADEAYELLAQLLPTIAQNHPEAVPFVLTAQADISVALGHNQEAEKLYTQCLRIAPKNYYVLRAYADLLLDEGREAEAIPLLENHLSDEGILLRAAIAASKTNLPIKAEEWRKRLGELYHDIRLRGGEPHRKFEARYELVLNNAPARALELSLANWEKQKEVSDTRILLESALASHDKAAAQPAMKFLAEHRTQHVILKRLIEQLEAAP